MATPPVYPGLAYVGFGLQSLWGTAVPPTKFARWAAISKGEDDIKTESVFDGLNRDPATLAKVMQSHALAFTSQLYPDFTAAMLFAMLGVTDATTGGTASGGSSTLSAGASAGATSMTVSAAAGFATGQKVQVGTGDTAEVVTIGVPSGSSLPITSPSSGLRRAHASSEAVATVQDAFVHAGSSSNIIPQPVSFEHSVGQAPSPNNPLEIFRTVDGVIDDIKIDSEGGKLATTSYSFMGGLSTPGVTAAVVAFETDRPAAHADLTPTFTGYVATPGAGLDLANAASLTSFGAEFKLTADQVMGAGQLAPTLLAGVRDVPVSFKVAIGDNQLLREIYYGSPSGTTPIGTVQTAQIVVKWQVASSPDHYLQLTFPNISAITAKPSYDVKGKTEVLACTGTARVVGGSALVTIEASNGFSGGYSLD